MSAVIERTQLAPGYEISRVIKGGWQLAQGHGKRVAADPVADMFAFAERGIEVHAISAATGEGVLELMREVGKRLA